MKEEISNKNMKQSSTTILENRNLASSSSMIFAVSNIITFKTCIKKITKNQAILMNFPLKLLHPLFYISKKIRALQQISDKFENLKLKPSQYSSWRQE